ncbi:MAG: hypothetical protein KAS73_12725 [Candidatus Sabulitectum sp.]|nr:hypothetical protein [Candidatus Sabulitectum sp.]
MPSSIAWLDHDPAAKERTNRILSLFKERESRDELGLGFIRDSLSDLLFPGTSTLFTRLRYMLIVPWVYQHLEEQRVKSSSFSSRVSSLERSLIPVLLAGSMGEQGIIGSVAGAAVKRLPSSIYWSGLGSWGIRLSSASSFQYGADVDALYAARSRAASLYKRSRENYDDVTLDGLDTWCPDLPAAPADFPSALGIRMLRSESLFIQGRIKASHPSSLLAHLAFSSSLALSSFPWEYSGALPDVLVGQLEQARLFSLVMYGASILYNVMLAELSESKELGSHDLPRKIALFESWEASVMGEIECIRGWDLGTFFAMVPGVSAATIRFVYAWRDLVCSDFSLLSLSLARSLVRNREIFKKGRSRSRFLNERALAQWGGSSGMYRLNYRWPVVLGLLGDLFSGLENDDA